MNAIRSAPTVLSTPRWLTEGYATYVEGVLTGSGRPHAPLRAAVLREWALAGALPTYDAMSDTQGFLGGAFAYLQGAAFVDWLAATEGDSSLTALWRRQSARTVRSFASAFAGVYGEEPPRLYQRFVADQIVEARAQTAKLEAAGVRCFQCHNAIKCVELFNQFHISGQPVFINGPQIYRIKSPVTAGVI